MEQILHNSFFSPESRSDGVDFSDDVVHVFELRDFVNKGPSGDDSDFVIEKKPVEVDCYHLNKVVAVRCKGNDLKSIISRVQQTGDLSLLNQRDVVYGDAFTMPDNLSDALQKGVETSEFIDHLKDSGELDKTMDLAKMSKEELDAYIKSQVDAQLKSAEVQKVEGGQE